jgi:teichoic acid transport system permease protein
MKKFFRNLKKYQRYAVRNAKAELNSEVADSYLNWLWWIIDPLAFMMIYTFIFTVAFKTKTAFFASFVFVGLTVWDFFNRMLKGSVNLIHHNREIVKKVYLPKYILLVSKSYTYLFKMMISMAIAVVLMLFQHVHFTWRALCFIPITITLYVLTFGIGLILMNYGVTIQDLSNVTNIFLRMIFYMSGVFYNINERLHGTTRAIMLKANPAAFLMNELRNVLLFDKPLNVKWLGIWFMIGLVLTVIGVHLIHKNENSYAKVI